MTKGNWQDMIKQKIKGKARRLEMTRVRGMGKRRLWIQMKRYKWIYALFIPTLVLLIIFSYMPLLGVQIAFRDYRYAKGIWGSDFVGCK